MGAPKLLFHGTCAVSVWASYRGALALMKAAKNEPEKARKFIQRAGAQEYFSKYGPAYPRTSVGYLSLTSDMQFSIPYSIGWEREYYFQNHLHMRNSFARQFQYYCDPAFLEPSARQMFPSTQFEMPREAIEVLHPLTLPGLSFSSPGAILIIDGNLMLEKGLLRLSPLSEEFARAAYLPWRAVRGIFITFGVGPEDARVVGYIFRDSEIGRDIQRYLKLFPHPGIFDLPGEFRIT